mmetsp:Transcript_19290/g.54970  ORF Transcript_19290/g.54970 Transcript_19290/m.54970 type:complete len:205 (+) Transcript_19290:15-629(+)
MVPPCPQASRTNLEQALCANGVGASPAVEEITDSRSSPRCTWPVNGTPVNGKSPLSLLVRKTRGGFRILTVGCLGCTAGRASSSVRRSTTGRNPHGRCGARASWPRCPSCPGCGYPPRGPRASVSNGRGPRGPPSSPGWSPRSPSCSGPRRGPPSTLHSPPGRGTPRASAPSSRGRLWPLGSRRGVTTPRRNPRAPARPRSSAR